MEIIPIVKAIHRLPIRITYMTDISAPYTQERKSVKTPGALRDLVRRWQALWQIPHRPGWRPGKFDKLLVSGKFDANDVLRCIDKNAPSDPTYKSMCKHMKPGKSCISVYVIIPPLLLEISMLANHFGVTDGIAFIQMQRAINPGLLEDPDIFDKEYSKLSEVK